MATVKNRLNVSLPKDVDNALSALSRRDNTPRATIAATLLRMALELEEDQIWNTLAAARDTKNARFVSHKLAWK